MMGSQRPRLRRPGGKCSRRSTLRLVALFALAGCYQSTPLTAPTPAVGVEVTLELTDLGAIRLASALGPQLKEVRGRVRQASTLEIDLFVVATTNRSGGETLWRGESVSVPREYVAATSTRRLDRKRTAIITAIMLATVVAAGSILGGGSGLDGLVGGGGGPRQ